MYNNVNSYIFRKKINNDYKLMPFNLSTEYRGTTKYLPPVAKEWKNSVYNYDANNMVNYPVYDLNLNKLIKSYFSLYFNHKALQPKYISKKKRKKSFNKIYVSKAEIKHTTSKAIITIYVYNREKFALRSNVRNLVSKRILWKKWKKTLRKNMTQYIFNQILPAKTYKRALKIAKYKIFYRYYKTFIKITPLFKLLLVFFKHEKTLRKLFFSSWYIKYNNNVNKKTGFLWKLLNYHFEYYLKKNNRRYYVLKRIIKKFSFVLTKIRRYKLRLQLNRYKFDEKFLSRLSRIINKQYGKKVEFNIVNLKSFTFNGDIFTEILTKKIRNGKRNPNTYVRFFLNKVRFPNVNRIIERARVESNINPNESINRYRSSLISSILYINPFDSKLDKILSNLFFHTSEENNLNESFSLSVLSNKDYIQDIIFKNIKYKNMAGVKIRVKGRLTKRYRADRAVFNIKWKGGLKNIDSAFKGLSSIVFRGHLDSNVEISMLSSKRRIGSFAVKGWFAGK